MKRNWQEIPEVVVAWAKGCNFGGMDLKNVVFNTCDLRNADFSGCNLSGARFYNVNLEGAKFAGANLQGCEFRACKLTEVINPKGDDYIPEFVADNKYRVYVISRYVNCGNPVYTLWGIFNSIDTNGKELTVFKAVHIDTNKNAIAKLLIPKDANRITVDNDKCRSDKAYVLGIYDAERTYDVARSIYDIKTQYKVGEMVYADSFDDDINESCSHGIHFFLTEEEAMSFGSYYF